MRIVLVCNRDIPPLKYGGTQRVVGWLAKGLLELDHEVTIVTNGICRLNHPNLTTIQIRNINELIRQGKEEEVFRSFPRDFDIAHFHINLPKEPPFPYLITFHWITKDFNILLPNTVFVSKKHALNHGRKEFVYNGLDPAEYIYQEKKSEHLLFIGKVNYPPKNVKTAIKLATDMKFHLNIAGGRRLSFSPYIHFKGEVGGEPKQKLLANSRALIFPTLWEEPFGLVTIEALISGTPVICSQNGAMPEIITPEVGFCCKNYEEYKNAVINIDAINPKDCRQRVLDGFTHFGMAKNYLEFYKKIMKKGKLT